MSEQRGLGNKFKRLFLEEEGGEAAPPASAAEEVATLAQAANAPHDPAQPAATQTAATGAGAPPLPNVEPAKLDFKDIYKTAGLAEDDLAQVDRVEKLLRTLPANLPLETQKQILEGTLKTFGVDPQRIRDSIKRQQRALAAWTGVVKQDADKRDAEAHARIESLRAEALKLEHAIEERARSRAAVELACKSQGDAVGRILDFLPAAAPESK